MREWISAIESIVVGAIDSGEVDVADLRTIVVAPAPGWQTLGVWLGTEWQDYPYPGDRDAAAGHISLAAWLDEVDAVARGEAIEPPAAGSFVPRGIGIAFVDDKRHAAWRAALARLQRDLVAACCAAASTTRLARYAWKHPVGIFA